MKSSQAPTPSTAGQRNAPSSDGFLSDESLTRFLTRASRYDRVLTHENRRQDGAWDQPR
jgi:hypothetical protein